MGIEFELVREFDSEDAKPYSLQVKAKKHGQTILNNYMRFETYDEFEAFKNATIKQIKEAA